MVVSIVCSFCKMGDCDHCKVGETTPGVLGGWHCRCTHTKKEKKDARKRFEDQIQAMLGERRNTEG